MNRINEQILNAAMRGRTDTVNSLIEHGANVNTLDSENKSPLHWAAQNGRTDTVNSL